MKFLLFCLLCSTTALGQVSRYTIADCIVQGVDGKKDTAFNGNEGNVTAMMNLDSNKLEFNWDTKDLKAIKTYKIVDKKDIKGPDYETMGVYSMKLKCLNNKGKECSVEFALNSRINKIQIVVVDGSYVLFFDAIQTQ